MSRIFSVMAVVVATVAVMAQVVLADQQWITYPGGEGPGKGKHIVLISGDEEYRSEEALTQLGMILAKHHGFTCTVLFAIDPKTGEVNPQVTTNIPGTEALNKADLMVIATRFRNLPDDQMKPIDDFLKAGKPVVGMRTATHAFNVKGGNWAHYSYNYKGEGDKAVWAGGFGKFILGETWVAHHGSHKHESTRGLIAPDAKDHPITRGIADGEIWGPTDVYTVKLPLPGDSKPIFLGQVVKRDGAFTESDPFFGMKPSDKTPVEGKKNDPMMPVSWTKTYTIDGKTGRVFTTTMGSSTDLVNAPTRRMIVNGIYWALGMEEQIPSTGTIVDTVGEFKATAYKFGGHEKGKKPADYAMPQ
jgi:type 1 glutamine amidotransferase